MLIQTIKTEMILCAGRDDLRAKIGTVLFSREFQILCIYRIARHIQTSSRKMLLLQPLKWLMGVLSGCEISAKADIGPGLRFPHPSNIIIGEGAVIGSNVTIYQGVTLGRRPKKGLEVDYPMIEDDVTIYPNSSILGGVVIGAGATVGAHSLVMKSFPKDSKIFGSPAQ